MHDVGTCVKGENTDQLYALFNERFSQIDHLISDEHDEGYILDKDPYFVIRPVISNRVF
jgi:hypothetical protein